MELPATPQTTASTSVGMDSDDEVMSMQSSEADFMDEDVESPMSFDDNGTWQISRLHSCGGRLRHMA